MNVAAGAPAGTTGAQRSPEVEQQVQLGKDAFLKLLTVQLKHQDPMEPLKDTEFVAQLSQFSVMEQLQNLTAQLELFLNSELQARAVAEATALLGREVVLQPSDSEQLVQGRVSAIQMVDGLPHLVVGNRLWLPGDVVRVTA